MKNELEQKIIDTFLTMTGQLLISERLTEANYLLVEQIEILTEKLQTILLTLD